MSALDLTEAVEAAARALYEATRAEIVADDPMISIVGVPWEQAPSIVQAEWREGMLPVVAAAAPLIEAQVRAQIAAEAVASDRSYHDDACRLLRDFAGGCGDNACPICCGDS